MNEIAVEPVNTIEPALSELPPEAVAEIPEELPAVAETEVKPQPVQNTHTAPPAPAESNAAATSAADYVEAAQIEIPQSAPTTAGGMSAGKIAAGILAGIGIPLGIAAAGGGGKGGSDNAPPQNGNQDGNSPPAAPEPHNTAPKTDGTAKPAEPTKTPSENGAAVPKNGTPAVQPVPETPQMPSENGTAVPKTDNHTVQPVPEPQPVLTTRIFYKDGTVLTHSGKADTPFQTASLKYTEQQAAGVHQDKIINGKPSDKNMLDALKKYAENKTVSDDQIKVFQKDSDGDGLVDSVDKYPNEWKVSDRDLRMFSTLAYAKESKTELQQVFSGRFSSTVGIESVKADLNGQVDISEYQKHWDVLEVVNKDDLFDSGLDYTIFGNGKQADGSYQNVVVAFRGTKNVQDLLADIKAVSGETPTQAKEMVEIITSLQKYNPQYIYSTGHSLGGYLAQYFATHTIQNSEFQNEFVRSALFNPAVLKVDNDSDRDLITARALSEQFARTPITDERFANESGVTYKTNSYVIKNEWVAYGFKETDKKDGWFGSFIGGIRDAAVGLFFNGLGTYSNSIIFNNTTVDGSSWDRHALANFYETSTEVQKYFSQGYRVDKTLADQYKSQTWDSDGDGLNDYQEWRIGTHLYAQDTDYDSFSDGLEVKLASDALDKDSIPSLPYTKGSSLVTADDRPFIAIIQTEDADGKVLGVKGVEMQPVRQDGGLVYTPSGKETDLGTDGFDWSAFESQPPATGAAVLQGTAGNDTLTGSLGSDTIIGGMGRDTFVFKAADVKSGSVDVLADFKAAEDRLDLTGLRPLFGDKGTPLKLSELLDDGTALPLDGAHLVLDKSAGTLAYKTSAADAGTVFLKMDADQAAALNAGNVLV